MPIHLHKTTKRYTAKRRMRDGIETLIVPVIMARVNVPMNDALIPEEEFHPQSWNGVPVTVQHPESEYGSANDPSTLSKYSVGQIFNATFEDGALKGEAWIDIKKANKIAPGLIEQIESGDPLDVSTGYFSKDIPSKGSVNGMEYSVEHHDLKPDHLALLPGAVGACSFENGCGVRANRSKPMKKNALLLAVAEAMGIKLNAKDLDSKSDRKAAVAALIANSASPYTKADANALEALSEEAFAATVNTFAKKHEDDMEEEETAANEFGDEEDKAAANSDEEKAAENEDEEKPEPKAASKKNAGTKEKRVMKQNCGCGSGAHTLSKNDREALTFGQAQLKAHRASLVDKIVANSDIKKEVVENWELSQLEAVAGGLKVPAGDYSGRPVAVVNKASEAGKSMVPTGVLGVIQNASKKKESV